MTHTRKQSHHQGPQEIPCMIMARYMRYCSTCLNSAQWLQTYQPRATEARPPALQEDAHHHACMDTPPPPLPPSDSQHVQRFPQLLHVVPQFLFTHLVLGLCTPITSEQAGTSKDNQPLCCCPGVTASGCVCQLLAISSQSLKLKPALTLQEGLEHGNTYS